MKTGAQLIAKERQEQIKTPWIKASERKPEELKSVLVYIPQEDDHITTGMWDVSQKWVLLDEYRVPECEVTYWREMVEAPKDGSFTPIEIRESGAVGVPSEPEIEFEARERANDRSIGWNDARGL